MKLTDLKGNALKVYLKLLEGRDAQGVCSLSHRALGRQLDLYRDTVSHMLSQLERFGLIEGQDPGWSVSPRLLADYLQRSGWKNQPVASPDGGKNQPPASDSGWKNQPLSSPSNGSGWKNQPPASEGGGKNQPPTPAPDDPPTRTRTLWSSSYEEDSICTAVPPSSSSSSLLPSSGEGRGEEGGVGGENCGEETKETKSPSDPEGENRREEEEEETKSFPNPGEENSLGEEERKMPPRDYLSEMQSWWATIAPEDSEDPRPWFTQLWTEFGTEIPLQVFREFVAAGRKRAELKYPDRYQRFFHTCCRNAPSPAEPPSPASDTEAAYENYEARMRAAYLADDAREVAAFENWEEKLRAGYQADDAREAAAFENGEAKLKAGYLADDAREAAAFENGEAKLKAGYLADDAREAAAFENCEAKLKAGYQADDARTAADFQARLGSLLADHASAHAADPDHVLAPFRAERRRS